MFPNPFSFPFIDLVTPQRVRVRRFSSDPSLSTAPFLALSNDSWPSSLRTLLVSKISYKTGSFLTFVLV